MSLLNIIKADIGIARRTGKKDSLVKLSTLVGEIQSKEATKKKELSDQEIHSVIRSFVNNLDETIKILQGKQQDTSSFIEERLLYSAYLPKEMSSEEIEDFFRTKTCSSIEPHNFGMLMTALKKHAEELGVSYNGKTASEIAKSILA